ncbi:MAG: hypothetical protein C4560_04750 [Nitrospiraceae bacterium]|nr:MAG: hypothetical protein C4560_04750 [Nitrospiraceae bacterium]
MSRIAKRILFIGWDGADWRIISPLIDAGKMPNLEKLIDNGVMGNLASLDPMLSPILWTSIATGKLADRHRILGFAEPDGGTGKIRPVSSVSRRCKALWNILSEQGLRCGVINWFASNPAEKINGFTVSDRFCMSSDAGKIPAASVYPEELKEELIGLITQPSDITPMQVLPFIQKPEGLDIKSDRNFQTLVNLLAQCSTVHNITTWLMENEEWDFFAAYYPAIDRFGHAFMEYHPPKMGHVSDKDFQHYNYVVEGCYRFHDMMLGRLLELAGEETTVIIASDHGFHHGNLRPEGSSRIMGGKPVAYHRKYGMLALSGPGIKKDMRVYGASILDVAPTILAMSGIPVPEDMDGSVLRQIFEGDSFKYETVDTYEKQAASDPVPEIDDPWAVQEMLRSLAAFGYIDLSGTESEVLEDIITERTMNLAHAYISSNRPGLAVAELAKLSPIHGEETSAKHLLVISYIKMKQYDTAEKLLNEIVAAKEDGPQINYQMGLLRHYQDRNEEALQCLEKAESFEQCHPHFYNQVGQVYLSMGRFESAQKAFIKALSMDDENAVAYDGLGVAYQKLGDFEKAVEAHMKSVALLHYQPMAHFHLGIALAEVGQIDWAIRALNVAIEQAPNNPAPKMLLAGIYSRMEAG